MYYWNKQYARQLAEGQPYKNLIKCVTINILNFSIIPNDRCHNIFHFTGR
ncbi:Rpn family recombination-promoting nuclease/putative transposase [Paenibacillus anseongensis]|nr:MULTISPECIES: Rpn family recombination-promoting nuclease/putative transposase [Paenibacillus]